MDHKCKFSTSTLSFVGSAVEQAQCLLRFIEKFGHVNDAPILLPPTLKGLLTTPETLGFTKADLRAVLAKLGVLEANIGGSLDSTVCRANNNDESASPANYFVIHDTSSKLSAGQSFDPSFIDTNAWSGNNLSAHQSGEAHVYISRNGKSLTANSYRIPSRATKFEMNHPGLTNPVIHKGRFLHHELVQPRMGQGNSDAIAPDPGFTDKQYQLLALCYFAASFRRGRWMIPAFHGVLDLEVGDHDDPQRFDLARWDEALSEVRAEMDALHAPAPPQLLRSTALRGDTVLPKVASGLLTLSATGGPVAGIGPVQDGLNLLSGLFPEVGIELGGNRGSFGPRTEAAVEAFQKLSDLPESGKVDGRTLLALDAQLVTFIDTHGQSGQDFQTPGSSSQTNDGHGGSTTTGLHGKRITSLPGVTVIEATETLTAKRDNHNLGAPKVVRQVRRSENGVTIVRQEGYCWGNRQLPNATLTENADSLTADVDVLTGRATFFGKGDNLDEGTGTPAFGTVQTNSSVFGISLPKADLLSAGLATVNANGVLQATPAGLAALVEVFFPDTGRRALLPLVDVGPAPTINAVADLTVAASAFLQNLTEEQFNDLDNIVVFLRVI